jgi:signal transduction histidine kinase
MRERAALLDAHLEIISKPGKGTEVVLELRS